MSQKDIEYEFKGKSDKLPIKRFEFSQFQANPTIIIIAKRGSGKSWIVRAIIQHFKSVPAGIIISPTDLMSSFYGDFFPESFIFYEYRSDIIEKLLFRQQAIIEKASIKAKEGKILDTRAFLIMDDCLSDKGSWANDKPIKKVMFDGRHYKLIFILTMQFPLGIKPDLRSNFDYIILLADDFISNIKKMYEHYAGMFECFAIFRQVYGQLTQDNGAMVIVNRGAKAQLCDKVYWYRAPDLGGQRIDSGCKQFRKFHSLNYNESWRREVEKKRNIDEFLHERKKSRIVVDRLGSKK
jgi:hypothetical protein